MPVVRIRVGKHRREWCHLGGSDYEEFAYNAGYRIRSLGQEDPLEKRMATDSSIPAWRLSWTKGPGRLQSIWSQRVRHN